LRFDPDPVVVLDTSNARGVRIHVEQVVRVNLPQPGVLRIPGVVHRHRPLRDRRQRILVLVGRLPFQRVVVERQRIEEGLDALGQMCRRLARKTLALRRGAELLQDL
jgi:hypothetical protein